MTDDGTNLNDGPVVVTDDVAYYRASALYSCNNVLLFYRLGGVGTSPPEWLQQRFDDGHAWEPIILNQLAVDYDFVLSGQQQEIEFPVGSTAKVRGHVDAIARGNEWGQLRVTHIDGERVIGGSCYIDIPNGEFLVVDAKALSQSSFEKWSKSMWKGFPYYLWQQVTYVIALDAYGLVMAVKNKNDGTLRVDHFTREHLTSQVNRVDIVKKVLSVEAAAAKGPQELFAEPCSPKQFPCPIFNLHPNEDEANKVEVTSTLVNLVAARQSFKAKIDQLKGAMDNIDSQIRAEVKEVASSGKVGNYNLSLYYAKSSHTDWEAVGEALGIPAIEAKEQLTDETVSDKLSIRVTERKVK